MREIDTVDIGVLMSSLGICIPCSIKDSYNQTIRPNVTGFNYKLLHDNAIIIEGKCNGEFFNNYMCRSIDDTAENMDVLRIYDIQVAPYQNYSHTIKYKFVTDSFDMHLIVKRRHLNTAYKCVMDTILHTSEMNKLNNLYGSMDLIDNSMSGTQLQFEPGDSILSMERILEIKDVPNPLYDWTFKYNINTKEYYVWDKIKSKKLTIDEWKDIAKSITH